VKAKTGQAEELTGWKNIATYLGQPVAVVQRWAKSGLPVTRQGRRVHASRQDLDRWLGRESGAAQPLHIASDDSDLLQYLRGGLTQARSQSSKAPAHSGKKRPARKKAA
jgi:phage terminase Nu1 subunit (DNA packaging protein)